MAATRIVLITFTTTLCTVVGVVGQGQFYNSYQPLTAGYNIYQPPAAGYNTYQAPAASYNTYQPPPAGYNIYQQPAVGYNNYQPPANPYNIYQMTAGPAFTSYESQSQYGRTCNDLNCKIEECCIETHRGAQCIGLTLNNVTNQRDCVRPKKCYSSNDCATGFCCVWAIDTSVTRTCPKSPTVPNSYGSGNGAPTYNYGYGNGAPTEGWCFKAVATNKTCWVPLPGQLQRGCPCKNVLEVCVPFLDPFTIGTCRIPTS